jgi:hypothetical protein
MKTSKATPLAQSPFAPWQKRFQLVPIALLVVAMGHTALLAQDNNTSRFENLREPKISVKKDQKVLVVEAKGDPNVIGGRAFGLLFRLYYGMPETPKGPGQGFPRARWPESLDAPKSEWTGKYAVPVPETVTKLPDYEPQQGLKASLTTWAYGDVAEILYTGPYDREEPTIQRLRDFITAQGYVTVGGHEEEYIKGPTMNGKGDPEQYLTIIRYRVRRAGN